MIAIRAQTLASILRVDNLGDFPQVADVLVPAAEQVIRSAVGGDWVSDHEDDPTLVQALYALVATWFNQPELFGEVTPGANFLLSQLQARGLGGDAGGQ